MVANRRWFSVATALGVLSLFTLARAASVQKTVVLVHGAFADGSSWDKVIPLLQAKGLKVVAVQNPLTSLADDVAATKRVIDAQSAPVVLVGHSWGGTVITQAGDDEKVAALVFVAAFAPDEGQATSDLGKDGPPPPGAASIQPDAAGYLYLTPEGVAKHFAQDLPPAQTKVMASTAEPTPFAPATSITGRRPMASPARPIVETRFDQMFPTLDAAEIDRLRRFGERRAYAAGERLVTTGEVSPGMFVIVSGGVVLSQHDLLAGDQEIVRYGPGSFLGELAQLSGQPSLVDAHATTPVDAFVVPSQRLHEVMVAEAELGERIMRALILRRVGLLESGIGGPVIVGRAGDADVLRLEGFLVRNGHPRRQLDPDTDASARTLVERFDLAAVKLPIVLCPNGRILKNPSEAELASCLGLVRVIDPTRTYDIAIVGAGPAGLAAAVYGASEGLSVLVLESRAFGGQAGASARIENYLGFPTGIGGMPLMARAFNQAQKFGAEMAIPDEAVRLDSIESADGARFVVRLANGERARARAIVIASGARYRRLAIEEIASFEGAGVHYWASPVESKLCAGQEVALVGAGNSAGQAAVYLASAVARVWMLARGRTLEASMSRYLVDRIAGLPNVEVLLETEVVAVEGDLGVLEAVRWRHAPSGVETRRPIRHLFLFIGADPNTSWLSGSGVALDAKGFVLTGEDAGVSRGALETSRKGVFAIGDVRAGSIKRVAAAVGEGAQVIAAIHAFLADGRIEHARA